MATPSIRRPDLPAGLSYEKPVTTGAPAPALPAIARPALPEGLSYEPPAPIAAPVLKQPRSWGRAAGDLGVGLAEGGVSAGLAIPQLVNTLSGGAVDEAWRPLTGAVDRLAGGPGEGRTLAQSSQDTRAALDELKSPQLREAEQGLAQTKGFIPSAKAILTNPMLLSQQVAEQVPQFIVPAGAARKVGASVLEKVGAEALAKGTAKRVAAGLGEQEAAQLAMPAANRLAQRAASKAAGRAVMGTSGAIGASQASEQAQQEVMGLDQSVMDANPEYRQLRAQGLSDADARQKLAITAGMKAGAIALPLDTLTSGLSARLEGNIFRGHTGVEGLSQLLSKRGAAGVVKAAGKEGAEETLQEGGEQFAQNVGVQGVDPNKSLMDQVPEQAALGGTIGAVMGAGGFAGSSALSRPSVHAAPPGSLTDAASVLSRPANGPIARAAQEGVANGAVAAAAQQAPAQAEAPSAQSTRIDPGMPPWADTSTGELANPSPADLIRALADHMVAQHQATGDMRINPQQIAEAWGVPKGAVERTRKAATTRASDQLAAAERAAMAPPAAPTPEPTPEAGTTASIPFMITQQMRADLRALGHTPAAIAGMTPEQAHAALQAGPVADDTAAPAAPQETTHDERVPEPAPAAPAGAGAEAARAADEQPAAGGEPQQPAGSGAATQPAPDSATAVAGERPAADAGEALIAPSKEAPADAETPASAAPAPGPGGNPAAVAGEGGEPAAGAAETAAPAAAAEAPAEPKAKVTRAPKAPKGSAATPANHVHAAIQRIAEGEHPEKVLAEADEATVRAVGAAMGKRFSTKAPLGAMVERIGETAASDRRRLAADALVKMGREKAAAAPPLQPAPSPAPQSTQSVAARKAESLRVKTPTGEVNGRSHVDHLIKDGYTQLTSLRAGDKLVHSLAKADGTSEKIHARQLAYAQERLAAPAEQPAAAPAPATADKRQQIEKDFAENKAAIVKHKFKAGDAVTFTQNGKTITGTIAKGDKAGMVKDMGVFEVEHPGRGGMARTTIGARFLMRAEPAPAADKAAPPTVKENLTVAPTTEESSAVVAVTADDPETAAFKASLRKAVRDGAVLVDGSNRYTGNLRPATPVRAVRVVSGVVTQLVKSSGSDGAVRYDVVATDTGSHIASGSTQKEAIARARQAGEGPKAKAVAERVATDRQGLAARRATFNAYAGLDDAAAAVKDRVEAAADAAASSPNNDKPEPTPAQKEAGNYEKGHVSVQGLDISIENPRGSTRSGVGENGKPWSHVMTDHYGYIRRTEGADGEQVDVYVGPNPASDHVYVVDQLDQKTGKFDEHKAMIGFDSEAEAVKAYRGNFDPGWKVGPVHAMSMDEFKGWLKDGDTTKPAGEREAVPSPSSTMSDEDFTTHLSAYAAQYRELAGREAHNPDYFNADLAKEMFPEYSASKAARRDNNEKVAGRASKIAFTAFEQRLKESTNPDEVVTLMAGGTGSGKSALKPDRGIVYDSTMYDSAAAKRNVKMVLDSGRGVEYRYVFTEPDSAFRAAIERGRDGGRYVNLTAFVRTHEGAYKTVQELMRDYAGDDRVRFHLYDNTDFAQRQIEAVPAFDYNGLREHLHAILDQEHAAGRVSDAEYRAIARSEPAARQQGQAVSDAKDAGRGPRADQDRRPEQSEGLVTTPETPPPGGVSASAEPGTLDDFGQRLEGARKFLPPSLKETLGDDQIATQPLSKFWPADAYKSIEDPGAAALAFAARAAVPAKPRKGYKLRNWVEQVKTLRALLTTGIDERSQRIMMDMASRTGHRLHDFFAKVRLLAQLPRETWSRVDRLGEYPDAIRYNDDGKRITVPFSTVTIDGTTHRFEGAGRIGPDEVQQVKNLLAGEGAKKPGGLTKADFEIRSYRNRQETFINRKGDPEKRALKTFTGPDALKEARAWRDANVPALEKAWEAVKARDNVSKADTRRKENRAREGVDRRGGKDVTPAMFEQALGFRGVQFGNWVGQGKGAKDRQGLLNEAYDALLDLADLLGIPSKAISLNGSLGLSLGARGHGWASAHFEPSNLVINLTKTRGSGTLAHEWFHALDNYFSRLRGGETPFNGNQDDYRRNNFVTYKPEPAWVHRGDMARVALRTSAALRTTLQQRGMWKEGETLEQNAEAAGWQRDSAHKQGVRPEVERAFADLVQALNDSPMAARVRKLDKSADGYWHRIIERAARAFENYVISKLALNGQSNDFLANVADWKAWAERGKNMDRYPYLRPEEEAPVAKAFDEMFDTVQTREDDAGNVALFSREPATGSEPFYSALTRSVDTAKGAPKTADAAAWKQWMDGAQRRGEFKQAEREWLGVDQWLAEQKGNVTREQLQQFVRDNQVQVHETELGSGSELNGRLVDLQERMFDAQEAGDQELAASLHAEALRIADGETIASTSGGATKFDSYQLPGGQNYRELLLTLPADETLPEGFEARQITGGRWGIFGPGPMEENRYGSGDTREDAIRSFVGHGHTGAFKSSHFDQPNILAHVRFNERTDADGKKVLFLEEIQSDWHQAGRRQGYKTPESVKARQSEIDARMAAISGSDLPADRREWQALRSERAALDVRGVPNAPFKKEWPMLAFKRMVRYAAENGFDRIAWTTGEQQAARYDLSKQIESITVAPRGGYRDVTVEHHAGSFPLKVGSDGIVEGGKSELIGKPLDEVIGKEMAEKIMAVEGRAVFSGAGLKVGGEGMQAFYDRMLPNEVSKWAKPFGAKVGRAEVLSPAIDKAGERIHGAMEATEQHSLDITPAMREAALGGLPMFRQSNADSTTVNVPVTAAQKAHTARIEQLATSAMGAWKGDDRPGLRVVDTPEQLPPSARFDAAGNPSTAYQSAAGMYDGRTIWIVASKHTTDQAGIKKLLTTMAHEGVGHYGVDRIVERELGAGAWTKIEDAADRLRQNPDKASPAIRAVLDELDKRYAGADRKTYAREFMAVTAERGVKNGLLDRVVTALRRWLRRVLPDLRLSEHELRQLLVASDRYLRVGETQQQRVQSRAALAFSIDNQTDTPAFRKFFGDSKVVDAAGDPLPVYHGTAEEFDTFDPARSGSTTAHMTANLGTFFAEDRAKAQHYAENASQGVPAEERVIDAYLAIRKPYTMSVKQFMGLDSQEESAALRAKLIKEGYDGIHIPEVRQWIAFQPNQIKSASENRGGFDTSTGNIYFSRDDADPDNPNPTPRPFGDASASIETMQAELPQLDRTAFQKAKDWVAGKARDFEPAALGALQLRHVLELAADDPTLKAPAKAYADLYQRMDGDRNQMQQTGAEKVDALQKWARQPGAAGWLSGKLRPEARQLFKFMHAVTQLAVDPTNAYEKLLMRDSHNEYKPWTKDLIKERKKVLREAALSRSGDDKTRILDELKELDRLPQRERVRAERYPKLVAQWNALSPEAKHHFEVMRDHYQEQSTALEEATVQQLQSLDIPDQNKRTAIQMVRNNFRDAKVDGVYFPLTRFGDYWISLRKKDGEYVFAKYETANAMVQAEKQWLAAGATIEARGRQDNNYRAKDAPSGTFIGDLMGILKNAPDKTKDEIYQMYLKTLPALSLRKHGIHRSNIAGYSDDVPRAFAGSVFHGAHQISKARYGWRLQSTMEQMRERMEARRTTITAAQAAHGDALLGELARRHDWVMNPTNSQLASKLTSIGFSYYLAASPASALVNLIQVPQIVLPVLGAQHGWGRATRVLTATMRDAIRTGGHIDKVLTGEDLQAFKALAEQGTFQRSAAHALASISEGDQLRASPVYTRVMNAVSWMFHTSEVINREGTGMAAFRLARAKGMAFDAAVKYADEITNGTHGDYSNANRARYMQGNTMKVLTQFKNYSLAMSWLWGRQFHQAFKGESPEVRATARRTLTGLLGMTGLFAGVVGMPIFNLLRYGAMAAHAVTGDPDEPWDFMTEFRAWLSEHLGDTAASLIADGAVSQLGANVASRVGMSDLWFRDADRQLEGEDAYNAMLQAIAGPLGGMIKNMYVGAQQFNEGHVERGIETMLPTFAKNAVKSVRFASQGVNTLRGDPIVADISGPEALIQAIGFQPTRVARQQRENNSLYTYQQAIKDRRQALMNGFAMAQQAGDAEGRAEALRRIRAFNAKNPEVAIGMANLHASLRGRAQFSAQASNGIRLDRKLAARLRREVGATPPP